MTDFTREALVEVMVKAWLAGKWQPHGVKSGMGMVLDAIEKFARIVPLQATPQMVSAYHHRILEGAVVKTAFQEAIDIAIDEGKLK